MKTTHLEQQSRRVAETGTRVVGSTLFRLFAGLLVCLPTAAQACTVCMGDSNSRSAGAINAAIFLMLGAVGLMLASFGAFAIYLSRRAAGPTPPHAELADLNSDDLS